MKIKQTLSWLKAAVIVALAAGVQQSNASSPPPWHFLFTPESQSSSEMRKSLHTSSVYDPEARFRTWGIETLEESKAAYYEGSPERAYRILDGTTAPASNNEEVMFWKAWYAGKAGRIEEAEDIYRVLIEMDPSCAWYYNALGHLLAVNSYARLDEAIRLLEMALEINPDAPAIIHSYGVAFQEKGFLRVARMHYEHATKELEEFGWGEYLVRNKYLTEIVYGYGDVLLSTGSKDEFEFLLERISSEAALQPTHPLMLRQAVYNNRIYEHEAALIGGVAQLNQNNPSLGVMNAVMLHRLGHDAAAKLELARVENLLDENTPLPDIRTYSLALREMGATSETEKVLRSLIEKEPENPWHYNNLGYMLADERIASPSEPLNLLMKALEMDSNRPEFLFSYAWVLHNDGRGQDAVNAAEQALNQYRQMDYHALLTSSVEYAEILWEAGRKQEAAQAWNYVKRLDENHPKVREMIELQHELESEADLL